MLYELLSPSFELEIDRALNCSPMSTSTANPILRRLGVAGGEGKGHFTPPVHFGTTGPKLASRFEGI